MRSFEELSGEWSGWWSPPPSREPMRLHLRFEGGRISGVGEDVFGPFAVEGIYGGAAIRLEKRYADHRVTYHGHRPNRGGSEEIVGLWRVRRFLRFERGEFAMRPGG